MPPEQLTLTVVEGGKGFDPSMGTGYQIKACSPGLAVDRQRREQVARVCTHYGQVVYDPISTITAAARDKELTWCGKQPERPHAVAQQILDEFPVCWSYTHLNDGVYALVRTCYRGYCPDRKPGNFFSHALVLRPEELGPCGHNPLSLSRAGIFASHDPGDSTQLPSLDRLPSRGDRRPGWDMLCREPWRNHIGAMLAALAGDSTNRPVILCLADWREALPLLEAVLWLLPPSARARTTFATYETDRYFFPSAEGVRPPDVLSAHQILFLCSAKDNVWNLYADDYQSTFAIFNFVGNRFSDLGLPSPFAEFALACVRQGQCAPLDRLHALIERLGLGQTPTSWDLLVASRDLVDPSSTIIERCFVGGDPAAENGNAGTAPGPQVEPVDEETGNAFAKEAPACPVPAEPPAGSFLSRTLKRVWEAIAGDDDGPPQPPEEG